MLEQFFRLNPLPACRVLELGAYKLPIVAGADLMDKNRHLPGITYVHDARQAPWPIADRRYDVFIALQVWEHLGNAQLSAFREVQRIASHAVLSFPFEWDCPDNPVHHGITARRLVEWTGGVEPVKRVIVPCGQRPRAVDWYSFAHRAPD